MSRVSLFGIRPDTMATWSEQIARSAAPGKADDQCDRRNDQEREEQDLGYPGGSTSDATKPEESCYQRDYEKNECPT